MKKISIIVPVLNEEKVIEHFHKMLRVELNKINNYLFDIKYILDKSKDSTKEKIIKIVSESKNTKLISLSKRFGHQISLLVGIDHSLESDAVIMLDSDLQHPPQEIKNLIKLYEDGYNIVNTSRTDKFKKTFFSNFFSALFYKLYRLLTSNEIKNFSADFRLISKKVNQVISKNYREKNIFLRGIVNTIGFSQVYHNYNVGDRYAGKSKYNILEKFKFAFKGIISFGPRPLYLLSFLSLLLFILVSTVAILKVEFFINHFIYFLSFYLIVLIFLSTMIGIYVGALYEENKDRPLYIVEEIIENIDDKK